MKFAVCIFFFLSLYSAYSQLTQIIGDPGVNEFAHAVTADDSGNAYLAGGINNDASVTCVSSTGSVLWTKTFDFPGTTSLKNEVGFIDIIGDTLFGCGWFTSGSSLQGAFVIKMNKNTGDIYWSKHDFTGDFYYSTIRYYNGQYFVVGADYVASGAAHDGKVFCLNSLDGTLVWQSQKFGLGFPTNMDYIDDFATMSEVVNGKFFIPGRSYPNGGSSAINMRTTLIGFDVAGNMICNKYLLFSESSPNNHRYYGLDVDFDGPDSLLVTFFGDDNCSGSCTNFIMGMAKTDLNGNISFAKQYDVPSSGSDYLRVANVTSDAYVVYGGLNFTTTQNKQVVFKTDKSGNLLLATEISIPGGILPIVSGTNNQAAGSVFKNGIHYFCSSKHNGNAADRDYLLIRLDEDLNSVNPCFNFSPITIVESSLPTFSGDLSPLYQSHTVSLENGINDADYSFNNTQCSISDISYNQTTSGCDSIMIEIVSASGIAYDITWSSGDTGFNATFYSSDSVIIEYYNPTNCCFMTDTIDFQLGASTLDLNMPNDTSVCINSGGTFLIEPVITNCGGCDIIWSDNSTDPTLLVSSSGWYSVEVSNSCGVVILDSTFVELNLNPTISSINDTVVCSSDFPLTYNFAGNNVDSILWSNGDTNFSTTYLDSGSMQVVVYSQCGNLTEDFSISIPSDVSLDLLNDLDTCALIGSPVDISVTGQFFDSLFVNDMFTPNNVFPVSSDTILNVLGTNVCSQDSFQVEINFHPFPEYTFIPVIDTCLANGIEVLLQVDSGNDVLEWWNGSNAPTQSVFGTGVYYFSVSNDCGTIDDSIVVNYSSAPIFNVSDSISACVNIGESIVVYGSSGDETVTWIPSGVDDSIYISESGIYYYQITNACGIFNDSLIATIDYYPEYTIEDTFFVCGDQFDHTSYGFQASNNYHVLDENGNILNLPITESGNYYFDMPSFCGSVYQMFNVQLNGDELFFAPNSFTPNADEFNNLYEFKGEDFTIQSVYIFNRWGEIVFSELGEFNGWDGTYKGVICSDGIYTVKVVFRTCDEMPKEMILHVNLLR